MSPVLSPTWTLTHSPAKIITTWLVDTLGEVSWYSDGSAWPIFVDDLPDGVGDDACTMYNTEPIDDGRLMPTGERCKHYGIQLGVRSNDYQTAWSKVQSLSRALSAIHNASVTVENRQYEIGDLMKVSSGFVGIDSERRNFFTSNFSVVINKSN